MNSTEAPSRAGISARTKILTRHLRVPIDRATVTALIGVGNAGNLAAEDVMARQLREGFAEATRLAVQEAHAAGLAVPVRIDGIAVEVRPDGEVVPIDDNAAWSPTDWRQSAKR
jgi:hypothetical protein